MAIAAGTRFGPYEVTAAIGAGGMGEVYRARDTTLEREVAIKVLPESFAADAARVARFEREAKTLASLNHLNIAQIYGLEKSAGVHALVMELVEGPTLADRITQGPLPVEEALNVGLQIADALEAAHEQGIVHRDLKPANVKLKPDGTVKVLDFGIAKALDTRVTSNPQAPPLTTPAMTQAGIILGTAAYMAPEQARGKAVDKRADVWAFGCVLYEMLTGQPAFGGEDVTLTLARVLERGADMSALPAELSPSVRRTLELCLQKDLKKRIRDIGDVRLALKGEFAGGGPAVGGAPSSRRVWLVAAVALALGAMLASALVWNLTPPAQPAPAVVRFTVTPPADAPLANQGAYDLAISPDGMRLVYVAVDRQKAARNQLGAYSLYVRDLAELETRAIPGTEVEPRAEVQGLTRNNMSPFFSADGDSIGFGLPGRGIMRMALESGAPIKVADYPDAFGGATWGSGGTLIFSSGRSLLRVSAGGGGAPEPLTAPSQGAAVQLSPRLLPGERAVIFTRRDESGPHRLVALDLATGEEETLLEDASDVFYTATGHLVFARAGTLMAVPFDTERLAIAGEAVALLEGVRDSPTIAADFALSATGTLVYVPAAPAASALVWVDRSGQVVERAIPDLALDPRPSLSPDGRQVAVRTGPVNDQAVWIYDLGGRPPILLADDGNYSWPVWSPDGSQVAFNSNRSGSWDLYTTPVDGSVGEPRPLRPITGGVFLWSQGELIAQRSPADASDIDIVAVPLDSNSDVRDVVATEDEEFHPALSPDGHWLAYVSTRTGLPEVLVKGYPDGVARRLSLNGGREPRWSADGRELFYLQGSAMMAVSVSTEGELSFEPPMQLFVATTQRILTGSQVSSYDVARDGRFLMIEPLDATGASIVVVQNWFEELKRRVPRD